MNSNNHDKIFISEVTKIIHKLEETSQSKLLKNWATKEIFQKKRKLENMLNKYVR